MAYVIGVSSGIWGVAKKGEELLGIRKKIEWTTTKGVNHAQIDLENITEFKEPDLEKRVNDLAKKLNLTFGIHGEAYAMGGIDTLPLASALHADYTRAHERLITHIEEAGKIHAKYITTHTSESTPFILLEREQLQPLNLVDIWGRPFGVFLKENDDLLSWAVEQKFLKEARYYRYEVERVRQEKYPKREDYEKISPEQYKDIEKEALVLYVNSNDNTYGPERIAYIITAKWMQMRKDPLWKNIVGKSMPTGTDLMKASNIKKWVPAVAAKYTWGHFSPDKCPTKSDFKDPKTMLAKRKMYWCFETPMGRQGYEAYMRMPRLTQIYYFCEAVGSKWLGITMDMEHMMGCNIDPLEDIGNLPAKGGERVKVVHVTLPSPVNPSHLPIPLGSEGQLYVYKVLYELRKKGFVDGWLNFERGGGEDPVQQTVLVMRLIVKYLEKDTVPNQLPEEFFGMKKGGPELSRQRVAIIEHAFDPLKGVLSVPEEEHGVLGKSALEKGKAEEWKKRKFR